MKLMNVYVTQKRINAEIESIGVAIAHVRVKDVQIKRYTTALGADLVIELENAKEYLRHYDDRRINLAEHVCGRLKSINHLPPFDGVPCE